MAQSNSGIGNVIPNTELVQIAKSYARSRMLCAAARLGVADALGDEVRSADGLAKACQADVDALYRLLRALASIAVTEETTPRYFRLTSFGRPLRKDVAPSAWPAVVFWADLLADDWSLLTDCIRTGKPATQVRDPNVPLGGHRRLKVTQSFVPFYGHGSRGRSRSDRACVGLLPREGSRRSWPWPRLTDSCRAGTSTASSRDAP